jgi:hypothetical protein
MRLPSELRLELLQPYLVVLTFPYPPKIAKIKGLSEIF